MSGLVQFIMSLFPAARRATRELENMQLVKEVKEAYRAKILLWGGALAVVGATLSFGILIRKRSRSARQANETEAREWGLTFATMLAKQEAELDRNRCEVRPLKLYNQ